MIERTPTSTITILCILLSACRLIAAERWVADPQPGLADALNAAPALREELLDVGVKSLRFAGHVIVPNRDGQNYDLIVHLDKVYREQQKAYIIDLGSGETRTQSFTWEEGRLRIDAADGGVGHDGNFYKAAPDWHLRPTGGGSSSTVTIPIRTPTPRSPSSRALPGNG